MDDPAGEQARVAGAKEVGGLGRVIDSFVALHRDHLVEPVVEHARGEDESRWGQHVHGDAVFVHLRSEPRGEALERGLAHPVYRPPWAEVVVVWRTLRVVRGPGGDVQYPS